MNRITVLKQDVTKAVYFICSLIQSQNGHAMHGSLSSKGDFMGGIFDRWINVIPESLIFNKIILPQITEKNVEIISDFYKYDPAVAGIAPDVIGLRVNGKVIPLVVFDEEWIAIENRPQIEIKTFKTNQKMVSLRNQGYDDKYLIMIESNFRIDYMLPFFDGDFFKKEVYDEMKMDDKYFIKSNKLGSLTMMNPVDNSSDIIGELNLLSITLSNEFMKNSTFCEGRVSVQRVSDFKQCDGRLSKGLQNVFLKDFCDQTPCGLYRFNDKWYDGIDDDGIPYRIIKSKSGSSRIQKLRTLDFACGDINTIKIIKRNKDNIYIMSTSDNYFNEIFMLKNNLYKVSYSVLERENNDGEEYFMQKELLKYIPDLAEKLKEELSLLINEVE